jgi:hypothetical protein
MAERSLSPRASSSQIVFIRSGVTTTPRYVFAFSGGYAGGSAGGGSILEKDIIKAPAASSSAKSHVVLPSIS